MSSFYSYFEGSHGSHGSQFFLEHFSTTLSESALIYCPKLIFNFFYLDLYEFYFIFKTRGKSIFVLRFGKSQLSSRQCDKSLNYEIVY